MKCINLKIYYLLFFLLLLSCTSNTNKIENRKKGKLQESMELAEILTKSIALDSNTSPKPQYIQIFKDENGLQNLTFLNTFNNSIYFYNYKTSEFIKKITYDRNGTDGIEMPLGYHIKNMDSIYIYNYSNLELLITNSKSKVLKKISLIGNHNFKESSKVLLYYPQFFPGTSNPFIETDKELLLPAQYPRTISDSLLSKIKFLQRVNFKNNEVAFNNFYPSSLYGNNYNWDDEIFTKVFAEIHPNGNKLIYSFPVSHNLYITTVGSDEYKVIYGGSNFARTITSIDKKVKENTREKIGQHIASQDLYGAIKYDKFRKVFYRFLRKGIPNASVHMQIKKQLIAVIMMDSNFNYLGETVIGASEEWNWQNTFVTEEGINIEYLDSKDISEENINFKIFIPKRIK